MDVLWFKGARLQTENLLVFPLSFSLSLKKKTHSHHDWIEESFFTQHAYQASDWRKESILGSNFLGYNGVGCFEYFSKEGQTNVEG